MLPRPDVFLLVLCLFGATQALYKQWIPDTNYENRSNWNTGVVPCGRDRVAFPAPGSVYVETAHSVQEMILPSDGELLLHAGAGFYVGGAEEPGCGAGADATFRDSDALRWFDPALWRAALTPDDLETGRHGVFSVHEESVPCERDDVVFRAATSFRVDTSSSGGGVTVRSVSVLGQTFSRQADLARYLGSASGRAQFHGGSPLAVEPSGCADPAGCVCDNSANRGRICGGVACPPAPPCRRPLRPAGHCCDVCGALLSVRFAPGFSLLSYRRRVRQRFLERPEYAAVQLAMSRVPGAPPLTGLLLRGAAADDRIQVVVLDGGAGLLAEALARDLLTDVDAHGAELGILGAEIGASSGNGGGTAGGLAGALVGAFFGVLLLVLVGVGGVVLRRRGWRPPSVAMPTMPSMPAMPWLRRATVDEALGGPMDAGFENPMFDTPGLMPAVPGIYGAEMTPISMTTQGVYFVNPAYEDHETDLTV
ncbi:protein amnionless [Gadus macrocephalus]|uniref:protein amnionless n=1 Tax=Gadus macrocephalus TaxID=80720 RepID=UPI0028CBA7B5|nr:protein amnionless [Gadus macrocephalus]